MAATLSTITPLLKEVYEGRIREQLNNEVTALKRITRSSSGVSNETGGKYVTFPVHTRRNAGLGARNEMEALPAAGQQGHAAARIGLKHQYGGIQLTGQAIAMSSTDPKAFAKVIDNEIEGLKNDWKKDLNRQVYGSGNGAIGTVRANGTGVNIVPVADARAFQIGAVVDVVTLPATVAVSARTVTAIDLTAGANTVTLSGATFNVASGQILVRTGSGPSAGGNREITGLEAIIAASGTLYNIDPASEPEWTAEVSANGGTARALSEGLMIQMADRIRTRGGKTTVIFQSLGVRRSYFNLLSQTRSTVNQQEFTGGFTGLAFTTDNGEIPVVADVDAPLGKQYFVNEEALTFGDYDAYYARLVEYHELGTDRRNTHGLISDLIES
jgi:hypothetical protein